MKLSSIDRGAPFALLGPGFGLGRPVLVEDLCEVEASGRPPRAGASTPDRRPRAGATTVVYAPFEARIPTLFEGKAQSIDLEFDVAPRPLEPALEADGYKEAVETIREAIAAGDVYQVCHTVRARLGAVTGAELFATLCSRGLPRFAAWVRLPDGTEFASASPELFFATSRGQVHTEPMKGTARPEEEAKLAASEKDRAELAMITDLLRDDLHRLCEPGSVEVTNERRMIELPYVVQAVADVEGSLLPGTTLRDVLTVVHPGGSVTGAPREAALQHIAELEAAPRGAYCGALGLESGGTARVALLIRTAERLGQTWRYGVGSGITWDSDPRAELDEVRLKLGALS